MINCNQTEGRGIATSNFITNLDSQQKVLLMLGGLSLPFDDATVSIIKRLVVSVFG